jgi:tryptophanyl-tRNA synthetase
LKFLELGVWATQSFEQIQRSWEQNKKYFVFVGFKYSDFHLGHLTLAREIAWHYEQGGMPFFVVSGHEGVPISTKTAEEYVNRFLFIIKKLTNVEVNTSNIHLDVQEQGIYYLEDLISRQLTVNKLKQLYGWSDFDTLYKMKIPSMLCASFLFPNLQNGNYSTVILADVNQATHMEILKIVSKKLKKHDSGCILQNVTS